MKIVDIVRIEMVREKTLSVYTKKISTPGDSYNLIKDYLSKYDREALIVMCLSTKNTVTAINQVSLGTLNASIVHPREIFKPLILSNSASFILIHNHPSGDPTPSNEDIKITKRIKRCGNTMGIELLDHIIIGDDSYISLHKENII